MMIRTLFLTSVMAATLASASVAGAESTYPCAPVLGAPKPPPTGTKAPTAPSNLRILGGSGLDGGGLDGGLTEAADVLSGPWVDESRRSSPDPIGSHLYFETLAARVECKVAYSLRSAEQMAEYRQSNSRPQSINYDPAGDTDPRRQDAAKIVVPADAVSLPNQLHLPIPAHDGTSLFVTWDAWWGKEFAFANTSTGNYKAFQFASPAGRIWTEVKSDFDEAHKNYSPAVATVIVRSYGDLGTTLGPNVTNRQPLSPQKAQFAIMPEVWTRYWVYFKPVGEWHEFSLWMADENREPVLLIDRLQIKPNSLEGKATGWEKFWIEYNTSSNGIPAGRGPLVSYARNVVMLHGVADPARLLERPMK